MVFATRFRLFRFWLLSSLIVSGGLVSSCQSSRSSFTFQPVMRQGQATTVATVIAEDPATVVVVETPVTLPPSQIKVEPTSRKQRLRLSKPQRQAVTVETPNVIATMPAPSAARKRSFLSRPQATTEVGLGTTVFGILGLVTLPIALLGLALSGGGLVWAIVAGAAVLAVLVAYIDPFGG